MTDTGIDALTLHCRQLRQLTLSGVNKLTDAALFTLASRAPHLHTLYMNGVQNVSSHVINYLKVNQRINWQSLIIVYIIEIVYNYTYKY